MAYVGFLAEGFRSVMMAYAVEGDDVGFRLVKSPSTKVHIIAQDLGVVFSQMSQQSLFFFFSVR